MSDPGGPAPPHPAPGGRWTDLGRRVASAGVLILVGVALALAHGLVLRAMIALLVGATFWELARMTGRPQGGARAVALALLAGLSLMAVWQTGQPVWLVLPLLAGLPSAAPAQRVPFLLFGLAILLVGEALVLLREGLGLGAVLWMIGVVVISDTAGYFVGRAVGGPKFWPRVSPKKTWSGTVAGWVGAALFGLALAAVARGAPALLWLSPLVAFAGQMGDIAESWLKRRVGVKDSSNLIPGHGGLMDRFDALSGATLAVAALDLLGWLPIAGGGG